MKRAVIIASMCSAALMAQSTFRTSVQYVAVDVVVTDKDDKPIEDLAIDDFEIEESGRSQKIADFQFVSIPAVSRNIAVNVEREPEPDVVTNVAPSPTSRLFAIVVDDLHLIEQDTLRIKRTLTDLVNVLSPDDEVAMVFVGRSNLSINFTRNTSTIMARIDKIKEALGFGLDALAQDPEKPNDDRGSGIGLGSMAAPRGKNDGGALTTKYSKMRLTYARSAASTLRTVAAALAGSSHSRRAIFFVTGGTTIDPFTSDFTNPLELDFRTLQDDYAKVFADAKKSDVPIYVIDPRGNVSAEDAVRGGMSQIKGPIERETAIGNVRIQQNNMAAIAVATGGRAVFNATDMTRMLQEIVQENGSYYLLGYYPDPFAADGRFHELKVRVKRDGARVRARAGYEAPSVDRASAPISESVSAAIGAGVNVAALPLRAFAEPISSDGKSTTVAVTVEVNYPASVDSTKKIDDNLELRLLALDPDARQKAASTKMLRFAAPPSPAGGFRFLINDVIVVPAQPLTLRIAVGSQALGKAGTVQLVVDLPRESKGLTLGGIAVGIDGPPRQPVMQPDAFDGVIPFQPTASRVFAAADVLRLFGHVYWKDRSAQPSVAVTLTGAGGPVTVKPQLIGQKPSGDQQDAVIAALLPMQGLAAGKYQLAISATLGGGKPVSRNILFEVK